MTTEPTPGTKKQGPKMRVIPSDTPVPRVATRNANLRVIPPAAPGSGKLIVSGGQVATEDGLVLTTEELRHRFARNLDCLLGLLGLGRKEAATAIGISYPLMRRLVSAGVSRADDRSKKEMAKLAKFFFLPNFDVFWDFDLAKRILTTDEGKEFVKQFKPLLLAERERRLRDLRNSRESELSYLDRALGFETTQHTPLPIHVSNKVAMILNSPKGDSFQRLIDDYYELVNEADTKRQPKRAQRQSHA